MNRLAVLVYACAALAISACQAPPSAQAAGPDAGTPAVEKTVIVNTHSGKSINQLILDGDCQVSMDFGSHASGIPYAHSQAANAWLMQSPDVEMYYIVHWGREGETSYCARVPDAARREAVAADLTAAVQALGEPDRGYFGPATVGEPFPESIPERDILQSDKFVRLNYPDEDIRNIIRAQKCHLNSNLLAYRDPLNQPDSVAIREWMIRNEAITKVYGAERSHHPMKVYAGLCAQIPDETQRLPALRALRAYLQAEFPMPTEHKKTTHLLQGKGGIAPY